MTDKDARSLSKKDLVRIINQQEEEIDRLRAELARSKKNSSTSSKPPSSDITEKPKGGGKGKKKGKRKRKPGGQPGHPRHTRPEFPSDEVDEQVDHHLECCPDCSGQLLRARKPPKIVQQVELLDLPVWITEHRSAARWCARCRKVHFAPIPREVRKAGLIGPRLTALVAFLKGGCDATYSTIETFLNDVLGIRISRGQLAKLTDKVSLSLDSAYAALLAKLPGEAILNVDETGHKENGSKFWTWCFRAHPYTLYKIDPSRGSDVLFEVLTEEYGGVIGADYFSAYRKYMKNTDVRVQFCLAHLIRDVRFLTTLPDRVTKNYGERVLHGLRSLFHVIHGREKMSRERFRKALDRAQARLTDTVKRAPKRTDAQNLAERFRKHADAYFEFIMTPGIDPTNNIAERALRFVVIHRRITQGTRGERGRRWCERIWTARSTCKQQRRSLFDFLCDSVQAHFSALPAPPLIPQTA